MTLQDQFIMALTIWRENRGGGTDGMQSVANVIVNRVTEHGTSAYAECTRPLQFSSITAKGDPQLNLYPSLNDPLWHTALGIVQDADQGSLPDLTSGANLYYNPNAIVSDQTFTLPDGTAVKWPKGWNQSVVTYLVTIEGHLFFKE